MLSLRKMMLVLIPLIAVGACTTLSDKDRALLTAASQNAEQAKEQSAQAQAAQASAAQAAAEAKAADEKSDRMFQRSLRK